MNAFAERLHYLIDFGKTLNTNTVIEHQNAPTFSLFLLDEVIARAVRPDGE